MSNIEKDCLIKNQIKITLLLYDALLTQTLLVEDVDAILDEIDFKKDINFKETWLLLKDRGKK